MILYCSVSLCIVGVLSAVFEVYGQFLDARLPCIYSIKFHSFALLNNKVLVDQQTYQSILLPETSEYDVFGLTLQYNETIKKLFAVFRLMPHSVLSVLLH